MAGFLYYFPGLVAARTPAELPAVCDLAHLAGASISMRHAANNGPDGGAGLVVACEPEQKEGVRPKVGIYPDSQTWIPIEKLIDGVAKATHYLGFEKDSPPRGVDLARRKMVDGWPLPLAGSDWVIPCCHVTRTDLPRTAQMTAAGPIATIAAEYEEICRDVEDWRRRAMDNDVPPGFAHCFSLAVRLVGINYRVGNWECAKTALGLLDSDSIVEIIRAALGIPQILAELAAKKNESTPSDG